MRRALLIDDEPPARADLRERLSAHPRLTIVGEAGTIGQARTLLARDNYDLVFLDIQLRGGTGFDLVPAIRPEAAVIFVTAFDQHALRAFEVNALDYLLKPVTPERLAASLGRLERMRESATDTTPTFRSDDQALLRTHHGDRFVPVAEISAVFSNENYSHVHLRSGEQYLTRRTLKAWEDSLPSTHFRRVHRQALVNLRCIEGHRRDTRETAELRLTGVRLSVPVSRAFLADLRPHLPEPDPRAS
ncbi:MAG: response regulator transcription factor [Verrucomicrobia bacterium]|nr:response regulator transcription factor [Verrucomicrobiota bacterium]